VNVGPARRNLLVDTTTLVAALTGAAVVCREARATPSLGTALYVLSVFVVVRVLSLGVHELGHLVAAALGGFRCEVYKVGPLLLSREDGALRATLRGGRRFKAAGLVLTYPPSPEYDTRARRVLMLSGGPAASALLAVLAAVAWRSVELPLPRIAVGMTAVFSAIVCATTLLPFTSSGNASDGATILSLLRTRDAGRLGHAR